MGLAARDWVWQWAATLALAGVACAHACLISLGTLASRFRWVRQLGWVSAFALAGLLIAVVWDFTEPQAELFWRLIGALAIVVAATAVALPVLLRLSRNPRVALDGPSIRYCVACGQEVGGTAAGTTRCIHCGTCFRADFPTAPTPP